MPDDVARQSSPLPSLKPVLVEIDDYQTGRKKMVEVHPIMPPADPPPAEDVTAEYGDLNQEDRIFRTKGRLTVKVKVFGTHLGHGQIRWKATASLVCKMTGKALRFADEKPFVLDGMGMGHQVIQYHHAPPAGEVVEPIEVTLEKARLHAVAYVERAVEALCGAHTLKGAAIRPDQNHVLAAEAVHSLVARSRVEKEV